MRNVSDRKRQQPLLAGRKLVATADLAVRVLPNATQHTAQTATTWPNMLGPAPLTMPRSDGVA